MSRCASIASMLLLSACISVEMNGPTAEDLQDRILKSNTVRSVEWFYPRGVPADSATYVPPERAGEAAIRSRMKELTKAVAQLHAARRPTVEKMLGKSTLAAAPGNIKVHSGPTTVAKVEPDGEIQVSFLVLQALLRGALLEDIVDQLDPLATTPFGDDGTRFDFNEALQPQNAKAEQQQGLTKIVDLIRSARSSKAPGKLGTLLSLARDDDLDDNPWFKLSELADELDQVESSYTGAILFFLAHEQGHVVLRHYEMLQSFETPEARCAAQIELEQEADDYALALLSLLAADMPIPDWFYGGRPGGFTGYRSFLQYSYPLSGFNEQSGCAYPSNKARFDRLAVKHQAYQTEANQLIEDAFQAALTKALEKKRRK